MEEGVALEVRARDLHQQVPSLRPALQCSLLTSSIFSFVVHPAAPPLPPPPAPTKGEEKEAAAAAARRRRSQQSFPHHPRWHSLRPTLLYSAGKFPLLSHPPPPPLPSPRVLNIEQRHNQKYGSQWRRKETRLQQVQHGPFELLHAPCHVL